MKAATLERVTLSDFQVSRKRSVVAYTYEFPAKGATTYTLTYEFPINPSDRFSDNGQNYAMPTVAVFKLSAGRMSLMRTDAAPQYVRDAIDATHDMVARAEQASHGIAPLPKSLREAWAKHGAWAWGGAKLRKAEEVLREVERPGVRREQAREIAAWIVRNWIECEDHEDLMADAADDARAAHEQGIADLEATHAEQFAKREAPAEALAHEARELLNTVARPNALEFAHGNTTTGKVLDLARDLEAALTAYENTEEP